MPRTGRRRPPRQRPVRSHERLLRGVFGLVGVAEVPVAGTHYRRAFPVDEAAECVPVPAEDCLDGCPVIAKFECDLAAPLVASWGPPSRWEPGSPA